MAYKASIELYSDFFEKLEFFIIKVPFEEKEHDFIGVISPVKCIHPVDIQVIIPKDYPYKKISFWTNSLYGYPHLIYNEELNKSWFCLNTPFAESVENQLKYDVEKLIGWFKQMMHDELPARIENRTLAQALRFANAYSWEFYNNSEYNSESSLIFIGDFARNPKNFSKQGYLHCKSVPLNQSQCRFYAYESQFPNCVEVPYIVVDSMCPECNSLKSMNDYYGWDKALWDDLLPKLYVNETYRSLNVVMEDNLKFKLEDIDRHLKETEIPEKYRWIVENRIELLKSCNGDKALATTFPSDNDPFNFDQIEPGTSFNGEWFSEKIKAYSKKEYYFALCVNKHDKLNWYLFSTTIGDEIYQMHNQKVGNLTVPIREMLDFRLYYGRASITDFDHFFGRGSAPSTLLKSKIAVIGAGAIGSILIESLVRSGVCNITVWDGDIVEPGNICRSAYTLDDIGLNKAIAIAERMQSISPFCKITANDCDLYGDVNYSSQDEIVAQLEDFDIIFDCTASNELLHFLSYSLLDKIFYSLCITNHAQNLLCLSSINGNVFEQRKAFLSAIEQDTKNFYVEGTGCYSPTFLATKSNISSLIDNYCNSLFSKYASNEQQSSVIYSKEKNSIREDNLLTFGLRYSNIQLYIYDSIFETIKNIPESFDYAIGYLLGGYSEDRKNIYVTHVIPSEGAMETLENVYKLTEGVIDYIGEIHYADEKGNLCRENIMESLICKAQDSTINTNNPLIATRTPNGNINFHLLNGEYLIPFYKFFSI